MARPLIAVDLDDVLTWHEPELVRHYNETYGTKFEGGHLRDLPEFERQTGHAPDLVIERMRNYMVSDEAYAVVPMQGVGDSLTALKERYRLVLLSSRSQALQEQVEVWIGRELPGAFESVHLTGKGAVWGYVFNEPKSDPLERLGASVLIDDSLRHVSRAAESGVRGILFGEYPWNAARHLPAGVERARDWGEVRAKLL